MGGAHVAGSSTGCRYVALLRVVHHHAVGVESPAEGADGTFHAADPAAWQPVFVAFVIERDDLFFQNAVKIVAIAHVMNFRVRMRSADTDGESVQSVVSLRPPSVQNGQVQAAIQDDFLATGARGL